MNIEHKKTALGDDSVLYQKRDDSFGRKDLKSITRKQKLQYFKDYYLMKVVVVLAVLIAVGSLLNGMFFNRSECVLSVAFVNESRIPQAEELNESLEKYLDLGRNDYVSVENYGLDDYQMQMAFVTKMSASAIDLTICPRDYFEDGCALGMFADLSECLPEETYRELAGRMLEGREAERDTEGNIVSYYDAKPYGIDLSGSAFLAEYGVTDESAVLCIMGNTEHMAYVKDALVHFFK